MCKAFSALVLKSGEVKWAMGIDSHSSLQEKFGLREIGVVADPAEITIAKIEITPHNGDYLHPTKWTFKLDESVAPSWWTPLDEKAAWKAHSHWKRQLSRVIVRKAIVQPFKLKPPKRITKKQIDALKQWASVWASVRASVRDSVGQSVRDSSVGQSVWASVRDSVGQSVWDSVGQSVWASVRDSLWDSVWDSVRDSEGDSVWASVWDSVWASVRDSLWDSEGAYTGSFFKLPRKSWKYADKIENDGYPFESACYLWEHGLVPSFDGKKWRLHAGKDAKIVWEGSFDQAPSTTQGRKI